METPKRIDLEIIASLVKPGSKVLDIGCGDGKLLSELEEKRSVNGFGIELSTKGVNACVAQGLSVIKGDAEIDLVDYPDNAFDYVILSHTIQAMHKPADIIKQMLRIGNSAIVSLPNFGYWRVRFYLLFYGRMPVSSLMPYSWYQTPNLHLCTIKDFLFLVEEMKLTISNFLALSESNRLKYLRLNFITNWFAQQAIFVLENNNETILKEKSNA